MADPTFFLSAFSFTLMPLVFFSLLQPTLRALKDTCLFISFHRNRKYVFSLFSTRLVHILSIVNVCVCGGASEFSKAIKYSVRLKSGMNADQCFNFRMLDTSINPS